MDAVERLVSTCSLPLADSQFKSRSTHSIRVTSASVLYQKQLSDQYIMTRLCWISNAFLVYLGNAIQLAEAHSKAIGIKLGPANKQNASYRKRDTVERLVSTCSLPLVASQF